jgi:hypothetical protein
MALLEMYFKLKHLSLKVFPFFGEKPSGGSFEAAGVMQYDLVLPRLFARSGDREGA